MVLSCSSESGMICAEVCLVTFEVRGLVCVDGRDGVCMIGIDKWQGNIPIEPPSQANHSAK